METRTLNAKRTGAASRRPALWSLVVVVVGGTLAMSSLLDRTFAPLLLGIGVFIWLAGVAAQVRIGVGMLRRNGAERWR